MTHRALTLSVLATVAMGVAASPSSGSEPAQEQVKKLSGLMPTGQGSIGVWEITPDGQSLVYTGTQERAGIEELFVTALDGTGSPVKLNPTLPLFAGVSQFSFSPSGSRIAYVSDENGDAVNELHAVSADGGAPGVQLALVGSEPIVEFTPDESRVVFRAGAHVHSVPADGSSGPVQLSGPMISGGDVDSFRIDPTSQRVVYRADQEAAGRFELYSAPADGSGSWVKLNGPLAAGGTVGCCVPNGETFYRIHGNGSRVLYLAEGETVEVFELYSVPIEGGTPIKISGGGDVNEFEISSDETRVVFRMDEELFSAPPDGSLAPVRVNDPFSPGGTAQFSNGFAITPDSQSVVFIADHDANNRFEIFRAAIDGTGADEVLNGPLGTGGDVTSFLISPDGQHVVFLGDVANFNRFELFTSPIQGGGSTRVNLPLGHGLADVLEFGITPDSTHIFYSVDQSSESSFELYEAPIDAASNAIRVSDPMQDISGFQISADSSRVAFRDGYVFSASVGGMEDPVLVHDPLIGAVSGDVVDFQVSADGLRVAYLANQDTDLSTELYSAPTDGSSGDVRLNGPMVAQGDVRAMEMAADGSSVVYLADQDTLGMVELYSVAVDGSAAPLKLNHPVLNHGVPDFALTLDGGRTVFRDHLDSLYVVPTDGSATSLELASLVHDYLVDPLGARVAFVVDSSQDHLFSVPLDGSQSATQLSAPTGTVLLTGGPLNVQISPDGQEAVYVASHDSPDVFELYVVPMDGAQPPQKLSGTMVVGGDIFSSPTRTGFQISPDGARVVYRADQDTDEIQELYSVPLDGSLPAVKLNGTLVPGNIVAGWDISPDGGSAVYMAGQDAHAVQEIYVVPIDGSSPPVKLNDPLVTGGDVKDFVIAPDSEWLVYRADQELNNVEQAYGVPLDRSLPPVRLNPPLPAHADVRKDMLVTGDNRVLYQANAEQELVDELYAVPIDGSGPPVRASEALALVGTIQNAAVSSDAEHVVFVANHDTNEADELYSAALAPALDRLSPASGQVEGGNTVRILGAGFTAPLEVRFGERLAPEVTLVSATEIDVVVPRFRDHPRQGGASQGRVRQARMGVVVDVIVSNGTSEDTLVGGYTYLPTVQR